MTRYANNPILTGFNPDPSICRVGDDYYIATSTFEWYPGVQVFHSTDLANWRLATRPLDRAALLDLRGVPDSCGVWAPCLTHADGRFWLVYTVTRRFDGHFKDTLNFLTTSDSIEGPWSDPVFLNASGFDPSLFHDEDGRKYCVNMTWDHREADSPFGGIVLQEYDPGSRSLTGEAQTIFEGSALGCTEGPHLYRFNDWYYLLTAEGGTGYRHAVTIARSKRIAGPYEMDPAGPVLTAKDYPDWPLQRAGHGDIVVTREGELFLTHLCSRPLDGSPVSPLGRETAIQKLVMTDDGWIRMTSGDPRPRLQTPLPSLPSMAERADVELDHFDDEKLPPSFQWLRTPDPADWLSLSDRPGHLRLYGRESPGSLFNQALVARRQQHHHFEAETEMHFQPRNFQQLAGLICYYNASKFHYLFVSVGDGRRELSIMSCNASDSLALDYPAQPVPLPDRTPVRLRVRVHGPSLQFEWATADSDWQSIGTALDARNLSDEAGRGEGAQFTGCFVGLCCNDVSGAGLPADFDYFRYAPL